MKRTDIEDPNELLIYESGYEQGYNDGFLAMPTLRDEFAMAALQGWISTFTSVEAASGLDDAKNVKAVAKFSYELADAMLEARK